MIKILTALVFLVSVFSPATASEMPTMVPVADFARKVAPIKAALAQYRNLPIWSGTFRVETTYLEPMFQFIRTETKQNKVPTSGTHLVTVDVTPMTTSVMLGLLNEDGDVVKTVAGDQDDLDQIKELAFLADAGDSWNYFAGNDKYVRFSSYGWTSVQFDPSKSYVVLKVERGDYSVNGPDFTVFSDYRLNKGRWTAWKSVDTMLVPKTDVVGKITTITKIEPPDDSTKVIEPATSAK